MNTSSKVFGPAAAGLAAGGLCWVTKFVVIAATDGAVSGIPDTITSLLYISAVALMVAGTVGLGVALTRGRHVVLRVAAGALGVPAWAVTYMAVEALSQAVVGSKTDPVWLHDEIGIVCTGALLLTVGLMLIRHRGDASPSLHTTPVPTAHLS